MNKKYIYAGVAVAILATSVLLISQQMTSSTAVQAGDSTAIEPTVITGVYEYSEFAPPNQTWVYTLTREQQGTDTSVATLYIKGFQTQDGMRVKLETTGDTTNVIFQNDEPVVDGTNFVKGDLLLSVKLTPAGNYAITWGKLKSNLLKPGAAEFKKVTETNITILVPQDLKSYEKAVDVCDAEQKCVDVAVKTISFVKKQLTVPYTYNTIAASAVAAANVIPTQAGTLSVVYLKIQNATAYVLLNIHEDGWAGVSFSLSRIQPLMEKTLLQFPEIKKVVFGYAPGDSNKDAAPSMSTLLNATYKLADSSFHALTDGRYDFTFMLGKQGAEAPVKGSLELDTDITHIAYGDLSYFKNVAVVVTQENQGGNGSYGALQLVQGVNAKLLDAYYSIGDRATVHSVKIVQSVIYLDVTNGANSIKPGVRETIRLIVDKKGQFDYKYE